MSAINDLVVRLNMTTGGFDKGATRSIGRLRRFGGAVGALAMKMGGLAVAAAGVGGTAAMGLMVKKQFAAVDSAAKLSRQLGIQTEKLAGLRHAAELTGAGAGSLDAGLATLSKRLGEGVRRGTGPAVEALQDLGLNINDIAAKRPDEAFYAIAEAFKKMEDPIARNAIAANLFSKANMGLVNTLGIGATGLADMQKEAARLGLTFSMADAAKIEEANDAVTRMKSAFGGLWRTLAIKLAPAVEKFANSITTILPHLRTAGHAVRASFTVMMDYAKTAGNFLMTAFRTAYDYVAKIFQPFAGTFKSAFSAVVQHLDVMLGSWAGFREGVINIAIQTALAFQATWEQTKNYFITKTIEMKTFFTTSWLTMSQKSVEVATPPMARFFTWIAKKRTEMSGGKWLLTPEEEESNIQSTIAQTLKGMSDLKKSAAADAARAIEAQEKAHWQRMAAIGKKSIEATRQWQEKLGKLPTLSGRVKGAWDRAGGAAAKAATPPGLGTPTGPELAMAGADRMAAAAGAGAGPADTSMFSGAKEKDSAASYSSILKAMSAGRKKPEEKTAKNTEKMTQSLDEIEKSLQRMENNEQQLTDIPGG